MKKYLKIAAVILLILTTIYVTHIIDSSSSNNQSINITVLESNIKEIKELSTIEYKYTDLGKYENYTDFYGWKVPFTTSKFICTYSGTIKAGFDLSTAKVSLQDDTITITLTQPVILSHEIDYDSLEIIDESYSIFNKITITQYNEFYKEQAQKMEQKSIENGLLDSAKSNGELFIKNVIKQLSEKEYNVVFKYID